MNCGMEPGGDAQSAVTNLTQTGRDQNAVPNDAPVSCAIALRIPSEHARTFVKKDGTTLVISTPNAVTIPRNSSMTVRLPIQMRSATDRHVLDIQPRHHRVEVVKYEPGAGTIELRNKMKQRAVTFNEGEPLLQVTLQHRQSPDPYLRPLEMSDWELLPISSHPKLGLSMGRVGPRATARPDIAPRLSGPTRPI